MSADDRSARGHVACGEVAEWLKAHAWNACIRATVSRVRIPLSPPLSRSRQSRFARRLRGGGLTGRRAVARWVPASKCLPHARHYLAHGYLASRNASAGAPEGAGRGRGLGCRGRKISPILRHEFFRYISASYIRKRRPAHSLWRRLPAPSGRGFAGRPRRPAAAQDSSRLRKRERGRGPGTPDTVCRHGRKGRYRASPKSRFSAAATARSPSGAAGAGTADGIRRRRNP